MDGGGGLDMVDAEEEPGDFENKRRSPYFELSVVFLRFLSAAVFIGIFLEGKLSEHSTKRATRTPPPY